MYTEIQLFNHAFGPSRNRCVQLAGEAGSLGTGSEKSLGLTRRPGLLFHPAMQVDWM